MVVRKLLAICVYTNAILAVLLSVYFLVWPVGTVIRGLNDPGLRGSGILRLAFKWHRALSPKYEAWARRRVHSGVAADLTTDDVAGTEWSLFGSVFHLWVTESLQEACEQDPSVAALAPKVYARGRDCRSCSSGRPFTPGWR